MIKPEGELKVSFGYQCTSDKTNSCGPSSPSSKYEILHDLRRNSSFSCLSGAALSANATLANTNICNGLIGGEILPSWDSPNSFRKVPSSPRLDILSSPLIHFVRYPNSFRKVPSSPRLDILSSSLQSNFSNLSCSPSTPEYDSYLKSTSPPSRGEGFLSSMEVQVAGGAAGEDRVQAVCSEENGWLYCAIYDGFNGRDAADFLAGTLYETIVFYFSSLDWESNQESINASKGLIIDGSLPCAEDDSNVKNVSVDAFSEVEMSTDSFRHGVLDSLQRALSQAENDFLYMVEQEMEDRPDLVSVGSCVLVVLLHGNDLYTLSLGDSRAVLATYDDGESMSRNERLKAIQLTDSHTVDDEVERTRVVCEHPDDPMSIVAGKVKGKLKVTRAFGVGYLKKKKLNDALMGILRVCNLISPPYVSTQPSLNVRRISKSDHFVVVASDGLFDFFTNEEAVKLVHSYIKSNPFGDPAKFLLEQLVVRAANCAGFSMEELMNIPDGRRRKYHDDVTVIVIILGTNQRTTKASTCI